MRRTRELELHFRRDWVAFPDAATLHDWAATRDSETQGWASWVVETLFGLDAVDHAPLTEILARHVAACETLAAGPGQAGSAELWLQNAGESARAAMDDLAEAAPGAGDFSAFDYRTLLDSVLQSREVRDPVAPHPGIMIWGTLEARVQGADLVILGGLNDGVWPEHPAPDPWLNRAMRRQAGLLLPERNIGLSAHDFQQAIAAKEVVLTRARRNAESETVPSRWLNRLTNLLNGLPAQGGEAALDSMRSRGTVWTDMAMAIERSAPRVAAAPRPSPRPPVDARPKQLSVTEIEKLLRDPYAVYARRVLGLHRLDGLARTPDPGLRGTVLHKIIERMLREDVDPSAPDAAARMIAITDDVLQSVVPWPATRRLWRGRVISVIPAPSRRRNAPPCRRHPARARAQGNACL